MRSKYYAVGTFCFLLLGMDSAFASSSRNGARVEAGRDLAQNHCSRCHGIGSLDESPLEQAPPFRRLRERYPIEQLAEAFAEGIMVGHTDMPPFEFQPREIEALLAYLSTLNR